LSISIVTAGPTSTSSNSAIGSKNALYRNMHDGTFKDVAGEIGIADVNQPGTGVSTGAVWGDYDNDGYEDLFLIKWGRPELYHNDQWTKASRALAKRPGCPAWINANTAIGLTTMAMACSISSLEVTILKTSTSGI
jgi:enediyne biosynthesis protein E4